MSNLQLDRLKSGIKNVTRVTLNLSSNATSNSNDEINFPHKLLLTYTQLPKTRKAFVNGSSANIKLSKTQLSKMVQLGGFLSRLLGSLLKPGLPLVKNVLKPLAKSILIPLGLTAAASATDALIKKKVLRSDMTRLIISNEEMDNIIKTIYLSRTLIKGVSEAIENDTKNKKVVLSACY